MEFSTFRQKLFTLTPEIMAVLLILQPFIEILSYFTGATFLRALLFILVSVSGILLARRKRTYGLFFIIAGGFWLLHILACIRTGYQDPFADFTQYLKLLQFPLWAFSFSVFFREMKGLGQAATGVLCISFMITVALTLLSVITHSSLYIAPEASLGIAGWASSPDLQSILLAVLSVPFLVWALKKDSLAFLTVCIVPVFLVLYLIGTTVAYTSAIFIFLLFCLIIVMQKMHHIYLMPLITAIALLLFLRGASPLQQIENKQASTAAIFQEQTDAFMGLDKITDESNPSELTDKTKARIQELYTSVYGDKNQLGGLINRFGVEKTAAAYGYTVNAATLLDTNHRDTLYMKLVKGENDFLSHLLGIEHAAFEQDGYQYRALSDLSALFTYYGYLGALLYLALLLLVVCIALGEFLGDFPDNLSLDYSGALIMFFLLLFSAFFVGHVFLSPSATTYFALSAATLFTHNLYSGSAFSKYTKKSVVTIKRV